MEKKVKKRIKIKMLPVIIVLIIALVCYLGYSIMVDLPIKNIYISGNNILSDQEIIDLAKISDYPSFIKTTDKKINNNLKKSPYIKNIKITRKIFNQLYIKVEENIPYFINTDNLLVLSNSKEIENDRSIVVPTLVNYTPDVKYEELIKQIKKIDIDIWNKVSEIKYDSTEQDKDRFLLYMNDGNLVYLTLTKFNKLNYYNDITGEFSCKKGILNLDSGNHFEIKEDNCE